MGWLIKILFASFPFVFAAFLFWPAADDKAPLAPAVEESVFSEPLSLPQDELAESGQRVSKPVATSAPRPSNVSASGIYRWVDENGNVVFSDQPISSEAVSYTPADIGYASATGVFEHERRGRIDALRALVSNSQRSNRTTPKFKFSSLSAEQHIGYVELSGRISEGRRCEQLRIIATAESDRGRLVRGFDDVDYGGFGSRLYQIKIKSHWKGKGKRPQWETKTVQGFCL